MNDAPVVWYKTQRFIALCQSTAILVLGWLTAALSTNEWAWRGIAIAVLGNVLVALKDWWSPTVQAPFAVMNRNNNVTVPSASVADAVKRGEP